VNHDVRDLVYTIEGVVPILYECFLSAKGVISEPDEGNEGRRQTGLLFPGFRA